MGSNEGRRTVQGPQAEPQHVCPACGQPVDTALKRRKILGVWAPVWEPQPCRNPDCVRYVEERADESDKDAETG
ncbi:hypothetical protein J7I98_37565 [Streptomyces sp. ISL-98]|uniref:hypothetical protein n=1 Tax=Streptomyces sp. ISL-98 TaxID=2819192 RepID=UPI001BE6108D|nr:hypothetical protein [Streptomyces sp. ISL-98]MBT2511419.1 hypothetical protein [Streptomyces sp. ISL-98]